MEIMTNWMRRQPSHGLPLDIAGDWSIGNYRYRFCQPGDYSVFDLGHYSITNSGQTLEWQGMTWTRTAGVSGVEGNWTTKVKPGLSEDITLGPYGYYSYRWSDGLTGGGSYTYDATTIAVVELRAYVACHGSKITFTGANGITEVGVFTLAGRNLNITFPSGTVSYTKIFP